MRRDNREIGRRDDYATPYDDRLLSAAGRSLLWCVPAEVWRGAGGASDPGLIEPAVLTGFPSRRKPWLRDLCCHQLEQTTTVTSLTMRSKLSGLAHSPG